MDKEAKKRKVYELCKKALSEQIQDAKMGGKTLRIKESQLYNLIKQADKAIK